jgi:hypothetical protein
MQNLKSNCSEMQAGFDTQRKEDINVGGLQEKVSGVVRCGMV